MMKKLPEKVLTLFPIILVMYEISNYLANDAYLPAMPEIATQLNTSHHLIQLTLTAFFFGNATMQLILGPISDRYGRRVLLLTGGIVFIATTILCALATNIYFLLVMRFFQGSAVTSLIVAGYATIHSMYDQTRAIKTIAWMNSITVLAPALGPLFGALILLIGDWRWIFAILAVWALLGWLGLFRWMPETCEEFIPIQPKKIIVQYGLVVKSWSFLRPMLILTSLFTGMIAWIAAGPFLVMDTFQYGPLIFGLLQALVFGAFILGTHVVGRFIHTRSTTQLTRISICFAIAGGLLSLILSYVLSNYLFCVVLPMLLFAFGSGIGFPVTNRLAIEGSDQPMGIKMALFASFMGVGGLLGGIIVSSFYDGSVLGFSLIIFVLSLALLPLMIEKKSPTQ